ncbi:hypothetical protein E3N88_10070 [Mikania micrantha]|uniref:Retroviral polymerase SH3-like domain-containing protein n=1 Tax=Mikania micrantha TaxID=192012 RepID=A0A5N6PAR7_9ASTR|nr:hypothetical protein E3N88_10070 [Mikania micrantha]
MADNAGNIRRDYSRMFPEPKLVSRNGETLGAWRTSPSTTNIKQELNGKKDRNLGKKMQVEAEDQMTTVDVVGAGLMVEDEENRIAPRGVFTLPHEAYASRRNEAEPRSKAYRLYNPQSKKAVVSRDVRFKENKPWDCSSSLEAEEEDRIEFLIQNEGKCENRSPPNHNLVASLPNQSEDRASPSVQSLKMNMAQ